MRVIVIMFIFICIIGLYWILVRYILGMNVYENYFFVVLLSDWFIYLIYLYIMLLFVIIVVLDVVYVVFFFLIFILLGCKLYELFLLKDVNFCFLCLGRYEENYYNLNDDDRMKDSFIFFCYLFCVICFCKGVCCVNFFMIIVLFFSFFFFICLFSCNVFDVFYCRCKSCRNGWFKYIYMFIVFVLLYLFCLCFMILSFIFVF